MRIIKTNDMKKEISITISEKLQQYMQSFQFFDDIIYDYIYIYDLTSERIFFIDKICERFPISLAEDGGITFNDFNDIVFHKDRKVIDYYRKLIIEEKIRSFNTSCRIVDRDGNKVWVKIKGTLREYSDIQSLLLVGCISEIEFAGMVDTLTGLYGKEKFEVDIKQSLKMMDGYLMIIDIDNFKDINITQGRAYGDSVLKKVADTLDEYVTYPMDLYRLDGDCFAVNLMMKHKKEVVEFYNYIKKAMKDICTISAGVVCYKNITTADIESVYLYAENTLEQVKKEGKNNIIFYSVEDYQRNLEQVELIAEMRKSIKENFKGFSVLYQPQINIKDVSLYGVEALLRYDSDSRGRISPIEFIPLLEKTGLICSVGRWVLKIAASQCKEWRKYIPCMHISINISYVQLQQEGIVDDVLDILKEVQLPGDAVTLEITESIQLKNFLHFNEIFYIWKQNGIKIAIDDFGTGYSNLSYLKSIEIDEVKIDRFFVDSVQYNDYNFHLLRNMIELAHSANMEVCCEGVETIEEFRALNELRANFLQGYLFAKPYTKHEFEQSYICTESKTYRDRKLKEINMFKLESSKIKNFLEDIKKE